jgi:hypothetical protein
MAEALGIAAAIVQLIDLGGRVLIISTRLCSDLKNVPGKIVTINRDIRHFIELLHLLELDLGIGGSSTAILGSPSAESLHIVARVLNEAIREAEELATLLQEISTPQSSRIKKAWNTIVSVKREGEITDRCRRLESLKSSLQLWYERRSVALAQEQMLVRLQSARML